MSKAGNVLYYFTLVMSMMYILIGIFLLFSPQVAEFLPGKGSVILGVLFIIYGIYRIFRLKQLRKSMEKNEN